MAETALFWGAVSKVFGDLVSKAVSDGVDFSKKEIKDADQNSKSYNQNLQTQIYHVIVDALNIFTSDKYKRTDKLYDAAENILKGFRSSRTNADAIRLALKELVSSVNDDTCQDFLEIICREICKDENSDLYKETDMLWKKHESEYIHGELEKSNEYNREMLGKLNDLKEVFDFMIENMNSQKRHKVEYSEISMGNRAEKYAGKWDNNVFLNDFKERDKKTGENVKLREIYLEEHLPHYVWKTNDELLCDLKDLLNEYIVENNDRKMLLILGQPGMGKSTLITWIMANLVKKEDQMLVYQFASDLKSVNWQRNDILNDIFKELGFRNDKLENKILILDGFDEINTGGDRERILNKLNQELAEMNILKKFSLIITCRENYVYELKKIECDFITLQTWDDDQIKSFCEIYGKKSTNTVSETKVDRILKNKEVFGVPFILYMVLALDITIEKSASLVDVYDQIFSLDRSSIYDRCIENSRYGKEHRISERGIKQQIHQISKRIAFWIFEKNSEKEFITPREYEEICDSVIRDNSDGNEEVKRDFLIGNYFKLIRHCGGMETQELHFIHRSIYEYFVVVYFFESLCNLKSKEEVAGKLGELLKDGRLSQQILEFVKYKFASIKDYNLSDITKEVFNIMLRDGMTYYIKVEEPYNNVIERERNIFSNMLKVVSLWNSSLGKLDKRIGVYLQCNIEDDLNLREIQLDVKNVDMRCAYLSRADLSGANLSQANLNEAYLSLADLSGANLSQADLNEANLNLADLSRANLSEVILIGANLSQADLIGANLHKAILIEADLSQADLIGANLSEANLRRANLRRANLSGVNLIGADLGEANLRRTNLSGAGLYKADLRKADLIGANLSKTIFDEEQVNILYEKCDLDESRVLLSEENKIISYQEYCIRRQKS